MGKTIGFKKVKKCPAYVTGLQCSYQSCLSRRRKGECRFPQALGKGVSRPAAQGWIITPPAETTGQDPLKDLPEELVLTYERLLTAEGTDAEILLAWAEALNKYDFWQDAQSTVASILEINEDPALELQVAQIGANALEHLGDPRVKAANDLVAKLQEISRITEKFGPDGTAILGALWNTVPKLNAPICFDPGQNPSWNPVWNATPTATAQLGTLTQCISAAAQLRQQLMPSLGE